MRRNVQATEREFEPILCSRDHPDAVILHHPPPSSTKLHQPPPSSTKLHQPPPTSPTCPSLRQAVASTLGNGGTSRNHSPASREFLSTSTSNRSATRTTVAGRWRPTRMWSTDSFVFFSTVSAVSTSTAATRGCDLRPGNTTRPFLAGSGTGRVSRVRMSSGHVTTSTPWMQPPATSMTTNEPSPPSRSTVPLRPVVFPVPLQATEDRKSTRLNSSHLVISYAVFCLKKKNK